MGSSSSRIGSGQPSSRINRTKRKLSSILLCGHTSDNTNSQPSVLELESPINSVENIPPTSVESRSSAGVSSSLFGSEPVCTSSSKTSDEESESCNSSAKNDTTRHDSGNNSEDKASTSYESQPIQESASGNYGPGSGAAFDSESVVNEHVPVSSLDNTTQTNIDSDENSGQNRGDIVRSADSDARALLVLSDSFLSLRMFGSGLTTSGPSDVEPDMISGGRILIVDTSELNSREARRNSGRLFGATSLRNSSRMGSDFPALFLATGLVDDLGSRDRWLLDISGRDRHGDGFFRSHSRNERRRHFRSQMSERGFGGFDEPRLCASGLHRDGSCSCGSSFMGEDVGPLGSISRVVLLAQALSEVLDEIHRQPLSLSMPMLSLPAPESVVDSFLLKSHKKMENGPNYVQQCYICLVDYEEGDKIRVLPCQHEYHAPCVDKWLKEVNGVCPVCRCNVCEAPVSSSEVPA